MMKTIALLLTLCVVLAVVAIRSDEIKPDTPDEAWGGPKVTELKSVEDMEQALDASKDAPVFIFKHSTACPISAGAAARVNKYLEAKGEDNLPKFYFVKVIESRPVSNALAEKLGVQHESPQIILIEKGKAVWNTSHQDITAETMTRAIESRAPRREASGL
jgi:bacillithiol system protein YtxJ